MNFLYDFSAQHNVVAANAHYYEKPTDPLYIDRTLQYHDLIYLVDGHWMITENETDYPLKKDDVLLLSAGYHHYTRLPCSAETRTFCIHITCTPEENLGNSAAVLLPPLIHVEGNPSIKRTFEQIVTVFWSAKPLREERMSVLVSSLMLQLNDTLSVAVQEQSALVREIVQLITSNPHLRYRCMDIAERFGVSTKTIETAFLKSTGMSFSKYQNQRKLEMAVSQMRVEPEVRMSEIAQLFGFYDEFHFSRIFKLAYGISPTQYRKTILLNK